MSDFISVFDLLDSCDYGSQRAVRDEVSDMSYGIKRAMDAGLTPDDMSLACEAKAAADAAEAILEKLFQ